MFLINCEFKSRAAVLKVAIAITISEIGVEQSFEYILPPFEKESPHESDFHTFPNQGVTFFNIF